MGITYTVDTARGIVSSIWTGRISAAELEQHWRVQGADPAALACRLALADVRQCHVGFTGEELRHLTRTVLEPLFRGRSLRSAIVVRDPVQYGVSRQYEAFAATFADIALFDDREAALAWLLGGTS